MEEAGIVVKLEAREKNPMISGLSQLGLSSDRIEFYRDNWIGSQLCGDRCIQRDLGCRWCDTDRDRIG